MDNVEPSLVVSVVVLLALSALFSASETAFSSINQIRLKSMAEDGNAKAKKTLDVLSQFDKMLVTILIGNNIVNIALSAQVTVFATRMFANQGVAIATGISTLLVLTFGEIIPKSCAKEKSEGIAMGVAPLMQMLMFLLTPFSTVFIGLRSLLLRKGEGEEKSPTLTEQELMCMLDTIEEEGVLGEQEKDLVQSALEFNDTTVQEIVTPRVNLVALDIQASEEEILNTVLSERYSRFPVYENTVDNVIGVIHSKDIFEKKIHGGTICLREMMSEVKYIHRTMKISKLLKEFQKSQNQLAVVIDDYGGTLGIVTLEDVLEELVGEIWDEDDEVVNGVTAQGDGLYLVSGDMDIDRVFEQIGYEPPKDFESSYNTMNGWALERLEHIPEPGESFTYDRLTVTVREMDDQKVTLLEIAEQPEPEKETEK